MLRMAQPRPSCSQLVRRCLSLRNSNASQPRAAVTVNSPADTTCQVLETVPRQTAPTACEQTLRLEQQEAQLSQRDRATRNVSKFVLFFPSYGSY